MLAITVPGVVGCLVVFAVVPHDNLFGPLTFVVAGCALAANIASLELEGPLLVGGAFVPYSLAIAFLGPGPAFVAVTMSEIGFWAYDRYQPAAFPLNFFAHGAPMLAVAGAFQAFGLADTDFGFYLVLAMADAAFLTTNGVFVTVLSGMLHGNPVRGQLVSLVAHIPAMAINLALGVGAAAVYAVEGVPAVVIVLAVILVFTHMTRQVLSSKEDTARIAELAAGRGRLVAHTLEAEERERRHLADRLHDGPVQNLLVARQDLADARGGDGRHLARAQIVLDRTVRQLRDAILELHPTLLAQAGLRPALGAVVDQQARRGGFQSTLVISPSATGIADRLVFSVVRELVLNAAKHARANRVDVNIARDGPRLVVKVSDDGRGFSQTEAQQALRRGHLGLASAEERVKAVGGSLELSSEPQAGTQVMIVIPIQQDWTRNGGSPPASSSPRHHAATEA